MNKSKGKMGKPSPSQHHSPQNRSHSKSKGENFPFEGVYQNLRFCDNITSLLGNTVQIHLANGQIFEGIFSTFSPQMEIVLELVHMVDPGQPDKIDIKSVTKEAVFGSQAIVMMSSKDVELDYATKEFATDSSISRFNGVSGEKELEPWVGDGEDCNLSLDNANGWDPNEMFARNEKVYGVQSSFEQDLSQYTCAIEKRDSLEFKEREAQAAMLASSIEGNATSKAQAELENASDEEEKFSAVVRPNHASESRERREPRDFRDFSNRTSSDRGSLGSGNVGGGTAFANSSGGSGPAWKYVHPNKRPPNKGGIQNMGKMMRSTPPPHSAHGSHAHSNLAPRHQTVGGGAGSGGGSSSAGGGGSGSYHGGNSNFEGDGRTNHPSGNVHHGGGYHQGGPQQHQQPFQGSQGRGSSAAGPYYGRSQGPPGGYSSNRSNSAQQSESRLANGEERKLNRDSSYDSKAGHAPSHSNASQAPMSQRDQHGPKDQRKSYAGKTRDDHNSDLKKFGQDFRLALTSPAATESAAPAEDKKATPSPTTAAPATVPSKTDSPTPSAPVTTVAMASSTSLAATSSSSAPAATVSVAQPPPAVQQPAPGRSPVVSPVLVNASQTTSSLSTTASTLPTQTPTTSTAATATSTTPPGSTGPSNNTSAVRESTPVDGKTSPEVADKVAETLKKSSLNPNAKEFVLNPNARVFIPTPPRSQTPQAQQSSQILMPAPMNSMGPVGPGMAGTASPGHGISIMPVVQYCPGGLQSQGPAGANNQPHFAAHNSGQQRFRKPAAMPLNHRPDLASSMHVAAATGQPLMAPAPMGGPQLFYPPHQGAMIPGTPQPYPQLYTMRLVGPQMQGMVPNSAYVDSSTTGHAPIYMSPGHGQGVNSQGQMGPPQQQQQQHHHQNSTPSPAQQHSMAQQTPAGNPPQLIYQTAGHHPHNPAPPHNHPHHVSFPVVFPYPGPTQLPPGVSGPSGGPGGPQGVQILPLGSSAATAAGMAAMGMAIPQLQYIPQGPGNQAVHRLA